MPNKTLKREGVMLAYHVDPGKLSRLGESFFIQPKYNGERCRVEWFHNEPILLSSYNNIFPHLSHIKKELLSFHKETGVNPDFDGELYVHGWPRERIDAAIRCPVNYNPDNEFLEYHVFDVQGEANQSFRLSLLNAAFFRFGFNCIKLVPTYTSNKDTWVGSANFFIDNGYEGAILRKSDALYTPKRTTSLLKFKPTEEDSYTIIAVLEAIYQSGDPKEMVGAFRVRDSDNLEFNVTAGKLLHSERIQLWKDQQFLIGRQLLVKHEKLKTSHGVPVCAVAVEIGKEK